MSCCCHVGAGRSENSRTRKHYDTTNTNILSKTVKLLYTYTRYNDISCNNSNLTGTKLSLKEMTVNQNCARKLHLILQEAYILNIC